MQKLKPVTSSESVVLLFWRILGNFTKFAKVLIYAITSRPLHSVQDCEAFGDIKGENMKLRD